jgi:hypothetical protein
MPQTHIAEGPAAQRRALTAWLRDLPEGGWADDSVRRAVARVHRLYGGTGTADSPFDSPRAAAEELDRLATEVESRPANPDALMAELYDVARTLDLPTPSMAREAAVAAVVWGAATMVEAPVRIVLTSGKDFVVGAGDPEGVLHTDDDAVLDVATGRADPDELADEGRWRFDGPDEVRTAFDRSFRVGL